MLFFSKKPNKKNLRQYKKIKINGIKFVIQKLNPFLDFHSDNIPQIFTSFISQRKIENNKVINETVIKKNQEEIKNVIQAGLVYPVLDDKFTIKDIMADMLLAIKLYNEIIIHSLNMFRGIKGLFFSIRARRLFSIELAKSMEKHQVN